ncbi:MiaB/RimO family radical SAM methylthiotransferase [Candidatus Falkowbacteria bacterium]|nr:MiaB/RimO family radical SAM methylthiotransferase [Candidatus Falkowbacteria bacterium]
MKNKMYYIIVIGCQMNKSDSERVAALLEKLGYKWSNDVKSADLVVITTCGVRQSAEDRVYGLAPKIKKENPKVKVVITGCLSERKDVRRRLENWVDIWLPVNEIPNLKFQISNNFQNTKQRIQKNQRFGKNYLSVIPKYSSKFSAFVPIGNGCDNFCAYCVVPYARGREEYRPAEEILEEVKNLIKKGYKEIILIAQNVNSYRSVILRSEATKNPVEQNKTGSFPRLGGVRTTREINFSKLLKAVNDIAGDFWIRFATSHPKDMSEELIETIAGCTPSTSFGKTQDESLRTGKVCRHIHLPAQAGDDEVLRRMNRKYTREHYIKLIKKIKKRLNPPYPLPPTAGLKGAHKEWQPSVSITTDIIVGFPGETKKQFNNTAKLFKEAKFDMAYIARYSPRPGTMAAKMADNVPKKEKKRREEALMKILRKTALENNKEYVGKVVEVLVEGEKNGVYFGKTETFKNIKITDDPSASSAGSPQANSPRPELGTKAGQARQTAELVGKFIKIKIAKVKDFGLAGEIVC